MCKHAAKRSVLTAATCRLILGLSTRWFHDRGKYMARQWLPEWHTAYLDTNGNADVYEALSEIWQQLSRAWDGWCNSKTPSLQGQRYHRALACGGHDDCCVQGCGSLKRRMCTLGGLAPCKAFCNLHAMLMTGLLPRIGWCAQTDPRC